MTGGTGGIAPTAGTGMTATGGAASLTGMIFLDSVVGTATSENVAVIKTLPSSADRGR